MIRLAHLSDIHIDFPMPAWRWGDWYSKRLTSWLNYRAGRARRFAGAAEVLTLLMQQLPARGIDHVVFSGDATALGFGTEIETAAALLQVGRLAIGALAVPGNHDYCTPAAAASGDFERSFAPWQEGRRIGEHRYPFAQRAGPAWLIGVNAAVGHRLPWDATGMVGAGQLERLRQLLDGLEPGLRILVLHWPLCLADGRPEPSHHALLDRAALLEVAKAGGIHLWLHGHRHSPYHLARAPGASFPVICAGTATEQGIWSHGEYTIEGHTLQAVRRLYDPAAHGFRDAESFSLQMP